MKDKILDILVCILLVSSLTPIVESATRMADNVYNSNVESDLNTFGGSAEKPVWNIGDTWEYYFSFNLNMNEDDVNAEISLSIYDLELAVEEETEDTYKLTVNGEINGDFSFKTTGVPRIEVD